MNWWPRLLNKKRVEKQLDAELRDHFERQVADNLRAGMTKAEARRSARLQFGGLEQVKEECRDARGTRWVESMMQDFRYALRTLGKSPGFTITAICTLALGIGANTAIFQLLNAVRLRSLPIPNPQELASITIAGGNAGFGISNGERDLTYPLWELIRKNQQAFSGVFAWNSGEFRLGQRAQERNAKMILASGEMFSTLGVPPTRGRLFGPEDDRPGCPASQVVISYGLWQSEFGGRDSVIGSKLIIQDHPLEVMGVTPAGFFGLEVGKTFDIALPVCSITALFSDTQSLTRRDQFWLTIMGRLKPGWTLALASAHLNAISPGLFEATVPTGYKATTLDLYRKFRLAAYPAGNGVSWLRNTYDTSLWMLLGITGLVLLIACTNLANLMLARASTRERENAVRLALGASRVRLIRHLLSEGVLLAGAGAVLGISLAGGFSKAIVWFLSTEGNQPQLNLSIDWRVLGFTAGTAILTCLVFGLVPALRSSRVEPGEAMKAGGRSMTAGRERFSFQRMLVISQIAVSLVLLVVALLFVRSFRNLMTLDPGFRENGILLMFTNLRPLNLPRDRYQTFQRDLIEEIQTIPQVEAAAASTHIPLNGSSWGHGIRLEGKQGYSKFTWVSPSYFETMQTSLLAGRGFTDRDTASSQHVAVVNETFVRKYLGGVNPIGRTLRTDPEPKYPETEYEIVGVVKDAKYAALREEIPPITFAPALQYPNPGHWANVFIRSSAPLPGVITAVKKRISELHPEIGMDFRVFQTQIRDGLMRERLLAALSGFFGGLAALLAMIGLYGVISYLVVRRRNEIGIRMALGASRWSVVGIIMREAVIVLTIGIALGIAVSLVVTRSASSLLFGLQPHDPLTLIGASALLICVAVLASFLPAQRASRVDPMEALRYE